MNDEGAQEVGNVKAEGRGNEQSKGEESEKEKEKEKEKGMDKEGGQTPPFLTALSPVEVMKHHIKYVQLLLFPFNRDSP